MKIAVYIDADNVSTHYVSQCLESVSFIGSLSFIKAFGNTRKKGNDWKELALRWGINSANLYSLTCNGKNAADMAICCDVMLQVTKPQLDFEAVCIVSTDSDFYPLLQTVKALGKMVVGVSSPSNKPVPILANLCDKIA